MSVSTYENVKRRPGLVRKEALEFTLRCFEASGRPFCCGEQTAGLFCHIHGDQDQALPH